MPKAPKKLAQAILDMSKKARMARAEKMGFDTANTWYHGTRGDIEAFSNAARGETTGAGSAKKGFFFAQDPQTAGEYAEISSQRPTLTELAGGLEDKFRSDGPAGVEYKRYLAEQDLKGLKSTNEFARKYLERLPETRKYWEQKLADKLAGSGTDKWTPESYIRDMLGKIDARTAEYQGTLSKKGQKELNAKIAEAQSKLDEITNYKLDSEAGQNVMPVHLKYENPLVHDFEGNPYREIKYAELMDQAKKKGHDAVIFKNTFDPAYQGADFDSLSPQDIVAVFDPSQIRSTNAKFDPKKKKSGNVLAGIAGGGLLAGGISESAEASPREQKLASDASEFSSPMQMALKALQKVDTYTGQPARAATKALLEGQNPFPAAYENFGKDEGVTGDEVAHSLLSKDPNLGFTRPTGEKTYPLEEPLGFAADMALDPSNLVTGGLADTLAKSKKASGLLKSLGGAL